MSKATTTPSQSRQKFLHSIAIHAILIFFALIFAFPLGWMVNTSLKPIEKTLSEDLLYVPIPPQVQNYSQAVAYQSDKLGYIPFLVYGQNTFILCILTVAGTVFSCSLVAYAFARLKWFGRDLFFSFTLATMMVPFPVLMVPIYGMFRNLGWIGTYRPLWVGAWFGNAFFIFLLRQFFRTIPMELSEAARIDGCSEWSIYYRVILPLCKPALSVVALLTFIGTWNDFIGPLIYLLDQHTFTLGLGLQSYQSQHGSTQWHLLMAASTIVVLPILVLFFFTQKQFIQGIAVTGLKG